MIRAATPDDIPALANILNALIDAGGTTALEIPFSYEDFDRQFVSGANVVCCHVAIDQATRHALGFQMLERDRDPASDRIDIATFARSEPKVVGVGTVLFAVTKARAQALGIPTIIAEIRADNRGGLAYYDKMGFRTFKTLPSVPLRDGTPVDRILKRFDFA